MKTSSFTISDLQSARLALPFYFISDTHISTKTGTGQNARLKDMLVLLEQIRESKGTLFILGDFFDFWFDKGKHIPPVLLPLVDALHKIIDQGMEIHYIGGNHDYWIKGYLTREVGLRFYPDALRFNWEGKDICCLHGDHVVYDMKHYPHIRRFLRDPFAIGMLKLLPATWIYKLGERISQYNQPLSDIPPTPEYLVKKMTDYLKNTLEEGYDLAISGHVHAPYAESVGNKQLAILGDWIRYRTYGLMDASGFRLIEMK